MASHHDKVMAEMAKDSSFCDQCGGWLGRKPGTKPFCTAWNCPGRFATQQKTPTKSILLLEREKLSANKFPDVRRDTDEEALIWSSASQPRPSSSSEPLRCLGCCSSSLLLLLALPCLITAWWFAFPIGWIGEPNELLAFTSEELGTQAKLIVLMPLSMLFMLALAASFGWTKWPQNWREWWILIRWNIGILLMLCSSLGLLFLIILPAIPEPGVEKIHEVCLDLASRTIRFDRAKVVGGPCFSFGLTTVVQQAATTTALPAR